jgi:hypothetical protein
MGLAAASLAIAGSAEADHVAEIGPNEGGYVAAGECYVGDSAFSIPRLSDDDEAVPFGVSLQTSDIKRDIVKNGRTLAYTCRFADVPTSFEPYDPDGPDQQPGTSPWLTEAYSVPKGGFTAYVTCWDRYNPGQVEGEGTIKVSHKGTAILKCDLRDAYRQLDSVQSG